MNANDQVLSAVVLDELRRRFEQAQRASATAAWMKALGADRSLATHR